MLLVWRFAAYAPLFWLLLNALLHAIFFFNDLASDKRFLSVTTEFATAVLDGKHATQLRMEPTRYFTDNLYIILLFLPPIPILFVSILITYCHSTVIDTIICITHVIMPNFHIFSVSYSQIPFLFSFRITTLIYKYHKCQSFKLPASRLQSQCWIQIIHHIAFIPFVLSYL